MSMMSTVSVFKVTSSVIVLLTLLPTTIISYKRNYESRYTNANIPQWKQRACEKQQTNRPNAHYICDDKGNVKCLPGWQGDLCQVPMCRRGCDPMNGYCQRPGECRCRLGFTGENCEKCIPLPGCQSGYCTKPFECLCKPGYKGLFCTEPTCRPGCHNSRGYCEAPGECRCRLGWSGRNCTSCATLPGCVHGTCKKPLECQCLPGYTGLLCQTPLCASDCHKQHGYCRKPGECRCRVGWTGRNCDKCFPYPGCVNGGCEKPWECNCKPGFGGMLCDEELKYCSEHPGICENDSKCVSLTKEDGSYRCLCKQGYLGKNCEIVDEFLLTSTAPPRITPPPLPSAGSDGMGFNQQKPLNEKDKEVSSGIVQLNANKVNQTITENVKNTNNNNDEDDDDDDDEEYEYEDDDEDEEDENDDNNDEDKPKVEVNNNNNEDKLIVQNTTSSVEKQMNGTATTKLFLVPSNQTKTEQINVMQKPEANFTGSKIENTTSNASTTKAANDSSMAVTTTTTTKDLATTLKPKHLLKKTAMQSKYKNEENNFIDRIDKAATSPASLPALASEAALNPNSRYIDDDDGNDDGLLLDSNIIPNRRSDSTPIVFSSQRMQESTAMKTTTKSTTTTKNQDNFNRVMLLKDEAFRFIDKNESDDEPTLDFSGTATASSADKARI